MKDKDCKSPQSPLSTVRSLTESYADTDVYRNQFLASWETVTKCRKPIIAAVSGYAVSFPSKLRCGPPRSIVRLHSLAEAASSL
jgi:hypothetical protein